MQRINSLDILRGIAIIGILFMNIYHHAIFEVGYSPFKEPLLSDQLINVFNAFFVDGRFRSLFCLLFGVGLAIQYESFTNKQLDANSILKSRMSWLLIFGLIHSIFVFSGDVLLHYALAGFVVYKQLRGDTQTLLNNARKYAFTGCTIMLLLSLIGTEPYYRHGDEFNDIATQWFSGYRSQLISQIIFTFVFILFSAVCFVWVIAAIVLFGVCLYREGFFTKGMTVTQLWLCIAITLALSSMDAVIRFDNGYYNELNMTLATFSGFFCALLYCHFIIKCSNKLRIVVTPFTSAGRIAFTLYITQSIVFALYFRMYNTQFAFDATRLDYIWLVVVFSAVQLVFASLYLRFFKQGPLEWLWRKVYQSETRS